MTIPAAPIPSVISLWQALSGKPTTGQPWIEKLLGTSVKFFSRGMWAMAEGVAAILDRRDKKNGQVWLPDYFCNEALAPLRKKEISLHFYPIKDNLSPDWDKLEAKAVKYGPPDVFILVHYFGFTNFLDESNMFCDKHGAELLEDCAHLLLPVNGCGQNTAVFSPRKLLSLPEGGLLIVPDSIPVQQTENIFLPGKKLILKWLTRRFAQRMLLTMGISWHRFRKTAGSKANNRRIDKTSQNIRIFPDKYALKLLAVMEENLGQVIDKRRKNYIRLLQAIEGRELVRPLFPSMPDQVCPYAFPILFSDKKDAVALQLQNNGIPASSWPDLPPEVISSKHEHEIAVWLQEHILLLPVHQDLSDKQVDYMASKLRDILRKEVE